MLRFWIDFIACTIQSYIVAISFCEIFPIKKPYKRSFTFANVQLQVSYFVVNYLFSNTPAERIISGTIVYIVFGFFYLEGNRFVQVKNAVLEYFLILGLDLSLQFLLFSAFNEAILSLPPLDQKLLGRNLGTASIFVVYVIFELFAKRKESKSQIEITLLGVTFGIVQLIILNTLMQSNPEDVLESRLIITAVFSIVMMGGFLVVSEMFKLILGQQKKQAELEQMALEKKYQYDYYQKALEQSEKLRDMRHDMRNQLQTVEYLLNSDVAEDRMRAEEMVKMLSEKAGGVC